MIEFFEILLALILAMNLCVLLLILWNTLGWPAVNRLEITGTVNCSILIPARNEAANIGACLDSALTQGESVEIIVCNDHSEDATAEIVRRYADHYTRIKMIQAEELLTGWSGKNFAIASLASQATRPWLLFLDADARLEAGSVASMIGEAERRGASLLSCWPRLQMQSIAEKMLLPLLNFVVFTLFPAPLSLRKMDASLGLAHGACILVRRSVYENLGGHALVRGELFEDTCLARAWRAAGERSLCLDGQHVVQVRMYDSFRTIWRGFLKNTYPAFRRETSFWLFLAFHAGLFMLPFLALPFLRGTALLIAAAAVVCTLAGRSLQAWRFRYAWWPVLLHPIGEALLLAVAIASWWSFRAGSGVEWKGRTYLSGAEGTCGGPASNKAAVE